MRIKEFKILALALLIVIIAVWCTNSTMDISKNVPSDSVSLENPGTIKNEDITDPVELEKLWQEYFYDAIYTVCNTFEFDSPQEIDPTSIARFCCSKYISEKGIDHLKVNDNNLWLFPIDTVLEYANRYFNITELDLSKVSKDEYNPKRKAFTFNFSYPQNYSSYTKENSMGIFLDKVTRNSDGTITAVIKEYDSKSTHRIRHIRTLTLNQRKDGSLYFVNGRKNYIDNNLVTITGNYSTFDKIQGFAGNMYEISMVGEVEGKLIMAYTPYNKGNTASLMLVNPETLRVDKMLELEENIEYTDIRQSGDKLIICLDDEIITVSKNIDKLKSIPIPKAITNKINRKPKYDANGLSDVFFGGYDVSSDLTKLVYSDEIGVKLYNITDNSERLLSKSIKATGKATDDKLLKYYYHYMPRFVAGDKKVITAILGYECIKSHTLCDLDMGTSKTIDISTESSIGVIQYDTGLLMVNVPRFNRKTQTGENATLYLDFKTGDVAEINLKDIGETGYIIPDYYSYVGQNDAAFITDKHDYNDYANNTYYINRLDLKTKVVEPKIISVKATEIHILGVLGDGRVIFWYNLNPSENGICITK